MSASLANQISNHPAPCVAADGARRTQVEPAGEPPQAAEYGPFGIVEQIVAPADDRPKRAVPWIGAAAASQQAQVVVHASEQTIQPQRCAARRGQLDRQRHALQPGAQLIDLGRRDEIRADGAGPVGEQQHGLRTAAAIRPAGNQGQRRHLHRVLSGDRQPLAAGGQHSHARAGGQQPLGERRYLGQQVLTIVEHQQRPPPGEVLKHGHHQRLLRLLGHPEHRRHRLDHKPFPHRHQIGEGATGREQRCPIPRRLHRQPRLAHAAGADKRYQPGLPQRRQHRGPFPLPAHETRPRRGQAHRGGVGSGGRSKRGQFPAVGGAELAQQRPDMTFDRAHRDMQPARDLGVGQVRAHRVEHLGLAR